jgi:hypothetical protein
MYVSIKVKRRNLQLNVSLYLPNLLCRYLFVYVFFFFVPKCLNVVSSSMHVFTALVWFYLFATKFQKLCLQCLCSSVILYTKDPYTCKMRFLSESPVLHYTIPLSSVCAVPITCLYTLLTVRMKYGNRTGICYNLLMLDSVRKLKFMCSREQDTI